MNNLNIFKIIKGNTQVVIPSRKRPKYFISLANYKVYRQSLNFYRPVNFKARIKKRVLSYAYFIFKFFKINNVSIDFSCPLPQEYLKPNFNYSYYLGTPSPYQKLFIYIFNEKNNLQYFVKLPYKDQSKDMIVNEINIMMNIKKYAPPILYYTLDKNYPYYVASPISGKLCSKWSDLHSEVINDLISKGIKNDQAYINNLKASFDEFSNNLPNSEKLTIEHAFTEIENFSKTNPIYTTMSHGDFLPWNIFITPNNIQVIDWEYARERILFYDVFHFFIHKYLLFNNFNLKKFKVLLTQIKNTISQINHKQTIHLENNLYIYLIDLVIMYLKSQNGKNINSKIIQEYIYLIENKLLWM